MDEDKPVPKAPEGIEGLEYPVEFELRVIYLAAEGATIAADLERVLDEAGVSLEAPRALPASGTKYGRLACRARFEDKEKLYSTYGAIGALSGVKVVL